MTPVSTVTPAAGEWLVTGVLLVLTVVLLTVAEILVRRRDRLRQHDHTGTGGRR